MKSNRYELRDISHVELDLFGPFIPKIAQNLNIWLSSQIAKLFTLILEKENSFPTKTVSRNCAMWKDTNADQAFRRSRAGASP